LIIEILLSIPAIRTETEAQFVPVRHRKFWQDFLYLSIEHIKDSRKNTKGRTAFSEAISKTENTSLKSSASTRRQKGFSKTGS
jgi:hypothetical protein